MKPIIFITVVMFSVLFSACSGFSGKKPEEVVFLDDKSKIDPAQDTEKEVVINDQTLLNAQKIKVEKNNQSPISTVSADGSIISVSFDSAGNKTESRCFDNHTLVGCIVLKTAAIGDKSVNILAQNGEIKIVPAESFANIMNVSADKIAVVAGITEGRKNPYPQIVYKPQPQILQPNQPLPSSNFPVQTETVQEQNQVDSVGNRNPEKPAENSETNSDKSEINNQ